MWSWPLGEKLSEHYWKPSSKVYWIMKLPILIGRAAVAEPGQTRGTQDPLP